MKWVVLVIVVSLGVYTFLTLRYRKPGPAYRPYQDAQDRATVARLLESGWSKIPLDWRRPVESPAASPAATVTRAAPGLGLELDPLFAEKPRLLAAADRVVAPSAIKAGDTYRGYFSGSLAGLDVQLGDISLYRRGNALVLVPSVEMLPDKTIRSRGERSDYQFSFATANLPAGRYEARLVANGPALKWSFTVD